jgi:hypothetical protein
MPETRLYGTTCKACKKSIPLGKVELPANAQLEDLRRIASDTGWVDHPEDCESCNAAQFCRLADLIFLS